MKVNAAKLIEDIINLRIKKGWSTLSIVDWCFKKHGLKKSQAYNYIKEARIKMGEMFDEVNSNALQDAIMLMENMLQDAITSKNWRVALDIIKEMNKINGLYIERVKLDGDLNLGKITFEIIKKNEDKGD